MMKHKSVDCNVNVLLVEWFNKKDLIPIKEYFKGKGVNLIDFESVYAVKYNFKKRFLRYWMHMKRFSFSKIPVYFSFIWNAFFTKTYVYGKDNIRKINIMDLSFEEFKRIVVKESIKGLLIPREDPWLHNLMIFSRSLGVKVIVLNNEHNFGHDALSVRLSRSLPDRSDMQLLGGKCSKDYYARAIGADKRRMKITGVWRFDVYHNKGYLSRKDLCKKLGLDPKKKIVFFPSYINTYPRYTYHLSKHLLKTVVNPVDLEYCWPSAIYDSIDMISFKEDVVETLYNVCKENKDIQCIIKLHPDMQPITNHCVEKEISAVRRELGKNFVGVEGIPKGITAPDILSNSDLVIGHNTTMLLEAVLMRKSVLLTDWGVIKKKKIWRLPLYEWGCADIAFNKNMFKKKILDCLKSDKKKKNFEKGRQRVIREYFFKLDGKACERVYRYIDEFFRKK